MRLGHPPDARGVAARAQFMTAPKAEKFARKNPGYRFLPASWRVKPPRCPLSLGWSCMARCSFPRPWQESLHHHPKIWIRISYSGLVSGSSHQSVTCIHTFLYMVHTRLDQRPCVSAVLSVTLSGSWVQIPHKAVPETVCVSKNLI